MARQPLDRYALSRRGVLAAGVTVVGGALAARGPLTNLSPSLALAAGEDPQCLASCLAAAQKDYQQEVKSACATGPGGHSTDVQDGELGATLGCQLFGYVQWQQAQNACHQRCCASGHNCDGVCTDLTSDDHNCGTCGHTCVGSSKCCNGHCAAGPCLSCAEQIKQQADRGDPPSPAVLKWFTNCYLPVFDSDPPPGFHCIQVCSDANNCGSCGNACGVQGGTTGRCVDGKCVYDTTGYGFCTADPNMLYINNAGQVPGTAA